MQARTLTKRTKRKLRREGILSEKDVTSSKFNIRDINPITNAQHAAFKSWDRDQHLFLHGTAGTGKTFISLYLCLEEIFNEQNENRDTVYIMRSVVPTRDMGFLPGDAKDKARAYEAPYYGLASEIFGRAEAYDILKQKKLVEFMTTSFIRGSTLDNCYVIVDEAQNMSWQELNSIITRMGENARLIFCGDFRQDDLTSERYSEYSGIKDFMRVMSDMPSFDLIEFTEEDIVRSALVKEYIVTRDRLGL